MSMFTVMGTKTGLVRDTTVQLYRNFRDHTFSPDASVQEDIAKKVYGAIRNNPVIGAEFSLTQVLSRSTTAARLTEQRQISKAVAKNGGWVILSEDRNVSIQIGDADHLCIQVRGTGLCPDQCLASANNIATLISAEQPFAFDSNFGYLTASPANLGTGLRISASIHLPALGERNMISQAISYAAGCGFQMRGIYGRDREVFGDLYQVSNQTTLGISEAEIAEKLKSTADNIAESELAARRTLREQDPLGLQDKVSRSLGVLKHARLMEMEEALRHLSNVMVGLEDKTLTGAAPEDIYLVAEEILPVMLEGSVRQRNSQRSDILRKRLDNVTENDKT